MLSFFFTFQDQNHDMHGSNAAVIRISILLSLTFSTSRAQKGVTSFAHAQEREREWEW